MVICGGFLDFLSLVGSFPAFLILGFWSFIFFSLPELFVFRPQLLEARINVFHGSGYACMPQQDLEFPHIKSSIHPCGSEQMAQTVRMEPPYPYMSPKLLNQLPAPLARKWKEQRTAIRKLTPPLEILIYHSQGVMVNGYHSLPSLFDLFS